MLAVNLHLCGVSPGNAEVCAVAPVLPSDFGQLLHVLQDVLGTPEPLRFVLGKFFLFLHISLLVFLPRVVISPCLREFNCLFCVLADR